MSLRRLDLGPGDVHRDGAVRIPRSNLGPSVGWLYGGTCAACGSTHGHDGKTKACLHCLGQFFETTPIERPMPLDTLPKRAPTGVPEPGGNEDPGTWISTRTTMTTSRKMISAAKRKSLRPEQFALPSQRKYPLDTARRVRNAPARLEREKKRGNVSPADYKTARAAIARAAKRYGIKSEYLKKSGDGTATGLSPATATHVGAPPGQGNPARPIAGPAQGDSIQGTGFRVSVSSHPGGTRRVEVVHAADRTTFGESLPVELCDVFAKLADAERRLSALPEGAERTELAGEMRKLADEAAMPRWNQIAKVGRFLGHPAGPFELTPAVFDEIVRNFADVDGRQVPIDFEHASEADESAGNIPVSGAPAQGWITDLQNRGTDGLYGLCTFLEPALSYVREGRYRSFSPAIRFGAKHPESGKPIGARLTSVALVTRPFLRGLQSLAARDGAAPSSHGEHSMNLDDKHPHEMMKHLKTVMGLHHLATPEDMKVHLDKLRDHAAKIMDKPHGHATGHISAGGVNCGEYIAPMADLLGAPAHMTTSELLDAVEDLINAAMEIHEVSEHNMGDAGDVLKLGQRLGTAEEKVRLLAVEKTTLARDNERLTLEAKAKDAKIAELVATAAVSAAELTKLRDAETKRGEEAVNARVEEAFATYKDVHKLSDAHRPMMVRELRADPANFEILYPRVAANQQHLLRNLSGERTPTGTSAKMGDRAPVTAPGPTASGPGGSGIAPAMTYETQRLLADKLVKERHMTREQATSFAYKVATGAAPMPTFTNN